MYLGYFKNPVPPMYSIHLCNVPLGTGQNSQNLQDTQGTMARNIRYTEVQHLLEPGELEGWKRRATDCNWSPEVFTINSYLIKENQPILYKLYNGPRRSFVREELQIILPDTMLP